MENRSAQLDYASHTAGRQVPKVVVDYTFPASFETNYLETLRMGDSSDCSNGGIHARCISASGYDADGSILCQTLSAPLSEENSTLLLRLGK